MKPRYGRCASCRHQVRLRADGMVMGHVTRSVTGFPRVACKGAGRPPVPLIFDARYGIPDCADCAMHMTRTAMLGEAIYSVSIETGGDPRAMLEDYLSAFHERGHQDES